MMSLLQSFTLLTMAIFISSCSGNPQGAGYWFHIIFILLPLVLIGVILFKRIESLHDSVFTIEGQIRRTSSKLDDIEEKVKPSKVEKEK